MDDLVATYEVVGSSYAPGYCVVAAPGGGCLPKGIKKKRIPRHPREASKAPLSDPMMKYHSVGWFGRLGGGGPFYYFLLFLLPPPWRVAGKIRIR